MRMCSAWPRPRRAAALLSFAAVATAAPLHAQQHLTLQQAIALAQSQGFQARVASGNRDAAVARDRAFNARLLPQISLGSTVPSYNRSINPVVQPDGSTEYKAQQRTESALNLNISQQLPFTGGRLIVSSVLNQTRNSGATSSELWQSTPFSIQLIQPILRPNTLAWDGREQRLRASESQAQYLEAREDIAINTTTAFFDVYEAQATLRNAESNAALNDTLYQLNQGRFEVGKIAENDLLQSELSLLRARNSVDGARVQVDRALAALRLAINAAPGDSLGIDVSPVVPDVTADTAVAVQQALRNRSQIRDLALQETQADRSVAQAKLSGGISADLTASYGYNATAPSANLAYRDLLDAQRLTLQLSMPLVQWGAQSADVQAAEADRKRIASSTQQTREQVKQDAHFAALQLDLARRQLVIAAKADTVAQKRFEVAYNRYVIGKIAFDNLSVAQNEKDAALLQFVQSVRAYWLAYYRLRRTTLYDFEKGEPIR
jgi:outer membrane protein